MTSRSDSYFGDTSIALTDPEWIEMIDKTINEKDPSDLVRNDFNLFFYLSGIKRYRVTFLSYIDQYSILKLGDTRSLMRTKRRDKEGKCVERKGGEGKRGIESERENILCIMVRTIDLRVSYSRQSLEESTTL